MHKWFCILLALFQIVCLSASAEHTTMEGDFTIRGGIKFGMTPEEVIAIEGEDNIDKEEASYEIDGKIYYHVSCKQYDSLAGIQAPGSVDFYFDPSEKKLVEFTYIFSDNKELSIFNELFEIVASKYGEPIHKNDGDIFPASSLDAIPLRTYGTANLFAYSEWLVKYDDCYVLIDEYSWGYDLPHYCVLNYIYVSDEKISQIYRDAYDSQKTKEEQIEHDI